jgi:phytoene dehydrogenase-like protein
MHGLSARIVCRTEASPLTFRRYDWSSAGAIYGKSGAAVATKSPIPGLVFAGAARQGAGIEVVVISGASAAEALVPELLRTPAKSA